ncbi:hypothetical protein GOP47_0021398 [Adiantum capillus-veneris]|uniref:RING-type E3 ubiquitin transferase n=1 Tax=Adiantum capillus-veneris TaxID=13818 RepID=A0A9D4U9I4_ADICA|nr:hypothetical protein GOP47_0021398 [Adiantum capillus-veneris]
MDVVSNMSYEYTKIKEAVAFMQRDESSLINQIKMPLLKYPSADGDIESLIDGLSFRHPAIFKSSVVKGPRVKQFLEVVLSSEGWYDQAIGKMYLVGCKEVSASLSKHAKLLEDGLDCSVEIKVEYPPTNSMLLMNPTIGLSIRSVRAGNDPFFFSLIELETFPLLSKRDCLSEEFRGWSQPGVHALFARATFSARENMEVGILNEGRWSPLIDRMVNLLALATFLCTLGILVKVYKSRIRLCARQPPEAWTVPNDKKDLFLLPQVIGNLICVGRGKPLRRLYYVGISVLRLLPHVYNRLRTSSVCPYVEEEFGAEFPYANSRSDFFSMAGDTGIPLVALSLVVIVYLQQRSNTMKGAEELGSSSNKLIGISSKLYERLSSETNELEMIESGGESSEQA